LGVTCREPTDQISESELVILPGVGSARSPWYHLESTGAAKRCAIIEKARHTRHLSRHALALEHSDEDGGVDGIGLLSARFHLLTKPGLDWDGPLVEPWGDASTSPIHAATCPDSVRRPRVSPSGRRRVLGVQFHPEKSGSAVWLSRAMPLAR